MNDGIRPGHSSNNFVDFGSFIEMYGSVLLLFQANISPIPIPPPPPPPPFSVSACVRSKDLPIWNLFELITEIFRHRSGMISNEFDLNF